MPFKLILYLVCSYCLESSLNKTKTKGKVLVCRHVERSTESKVAKSKIVKEAGGVGMILIDETDQDVAIPFVIPSAIVGKKKGQKILSYLKTTRFVYSLQITYTFMDLNPLQVQLGTVEVGTH